MPYVFDALQDFIASLAEVDLLCDVAEQFQNDIQRSNIFNKVSVLLVAGKFESFVESILEEYIFALNACALPANLISDTIKLHHTFHALENSDSRKAPHKHREAIELFTSLGKIWASSEQCNSLKLPLSLSYGKHGEKELVKLFLRIGIADIFEAVELVDQVEVLSVDHPVMEPVNFRGVFNSVTQLRNHILHEDASPNLTTVQIRDFRRYFTGFADGVALLLEKHLPSTDENEVGHTDPDEIQKSSRLIQLLSTDSVPEPDFG